MVANSKWQTQPLGEVADLCLGKMLDQKKNKGEPLSYLANVNVRWGEFALENLRTMRFEPKEIERFGLKFGDIVMCEGGEPGRCAIWKNQVPGMMIQKALHLIRPCQDLDYRFLYYSFLHIGQSRGFDQFFTRATIYHLPLEKLAKVEVPLPPLSVQRRIAGILSGYDELIENCQQRIRILGAIARALYREWFVHFRFPGHEKHPRVASPLGDIPQGWEVKPLDAVVEDIVDYRGKTPTKLGGDWSDEGIIALSALNVKGGRLVNLEKSKRVDEDLYSRWMKNPLREGDILMTSEAPLGELFFLCKHERYCLSQRLFSIRANREVIAPVFLYLSLESEQTQHELQSRASGATVSGIRQSELRKVPIVVPSPVIQQHAEPILQRLAEQIHTLDAQIQNLRRTRDLLLPRLLSGQVALEGN
jgi:type I restriction enzyme S subunit